MADLTPPALRRSTSWAERFPDAALLDGALPGEGLVAFLDSLDPADIDAPTLLEVVAGWDRVASWAAARQALAVAEMVRRAPSSHVEFIADEVGARLGVSRRAAQDVVDLATGLDAYPAVHGALGRGDVDRRKAQLLLTETEHLPAPTARAIHDVVLPRAAHLSAPQLRLAVRRAEAGLEPAATAGRAQRARGDRCVRMVPAPDAMAWIHALLPAPDAIAVLTAVDALAAFAAPEDDRTADQRRADALSDLCRRTLDAGVGPDGTPLPVRQHRRPHLQVTVSAATLAAHAQGIAGVAELAGYGPVPFASVAHLVAAATWRPVLTDDETGVVIAVGDRTYRPSAGLAALVAARDTTCTFPGCRIAAQRCDLDHIDPFDPVRPAEEQTIETNLHPLCRHHHRLKTAGRWRVERDPVTAVTTWHGPAGRSYTRDPVPADPARWDVPRRVARPVAGPAGRGDEDVPPRATRPLGEESAVRTPPDPPDAGGPAPF